MFKDNDVHNLDVDIVWDIIQNELPETKKQIKKLLLKSKGKIE